MDQLKLKRLVEDMELKPFDCGDDDLNDFFLNDAKKLSSKLLATTYILESDTETVAFFSLLNDKISLTQFPNGNQFKKFKKNCKVLARGKSFESYPAMKIGRFAVSSNHQRKDIGKMLINYIKNLFITNNRTGCRFLTVDAYNNKRAIHFYEEKNKFKMFPNGNNSDKTRLMYFDLIELIAEE